MDVVLSEGDVVEPDLLFVAKEQLGIVTADNIQGAPDLVVEIISEGSRKRDVITKRHIYERYGGASTGSSTRRKRPSGSLTSRTAPTGNRSR